MSELHPLLAAVVAGHSAARDVVKTSLITDRLSPAMLEEVGRRMTADAEASRLAWAQRDKPREPLSITEGLNLISRLMDGFDLG